MPPPIHPAAPDLIIRLPNHLGDACMALPALQLLAQGGVAFSLVGRAWAPALFGGTAWPVQALPGARVRRIFALRALRTDGASGLLLTNSFSSALEMRLAGLGPIGYATDGRRLLLRRPVQVPPSWAGDLHTIDYYLALVRAWLGDASRAPARQGDAMAPMAAPALPLAPSARAQASQALRRAGVARPYVVLCPVAVGRHRGRDKCWEGFGRLDERLHAMGWTTLICPGPGEREAARRAVPLAVEIEALDVGAFAALLAGSELVVANDSGPGHLAAAVGARLIGVFGVTDPTKTCPRGARVRIAGGAQGWPSFDAVEAAVRDALLDQAPA